MRSKNFAFVVLLITVSACANMTVDVRVLDKKCIPEEDWLEAVVFDARDRVLAHQAEGTFERVLEQVELDAGKLASELVTVSQLGIDDPGVFRNTLVTNTRLEFEAAGNEYQEALNITRKAELAENADERLLLLKKAKLRFDHADVRLLNLASMFRAEYEEVEVIPTAEIAASTRSKVSMYTADLQVNLRSLTGGQSLLDDRRVDLVVHAPKECWTGIFNRTRGRGFAGNSDIAIKMEGVGNFTLKGVRLDAGKMTTAAFQGISQAVQIAGAAYGLPQAVSGGEVAGKQVAVETLSAAEAGKRRLEARQRVMNDAKMSLLEAILAERSALGKDETRTAAVARIQQAFEAYRQFLDPQTPQSSGSSTSINGVVKPD